MLFLEKVELIKETKKDKRKREAMDFRQSVPEYLTSKKNTFIQIGFTACFAYAFINLYMPFGVELWYDVDILQFRLLSGVVVLIGMAVVTIMRLIMLQLKKNHEVTMAFYIWMIVCEVVLLSGFFTLIEKLALKDVRSTMSLMMNAIQNTVLILLIPYILSALFFSWTDIRKKFELVIHQFRDPSEVFVPFKDEKDRVCITLKLSDIIYMESNDNYVNIYYADNNVVKRFMLRNTIKKLEADIVKYSIIRCHRRYSINKVNVKFLRKCKLGYEAVMKDKDETVIPVSKSYQDILMKMLNYDSKLDASVD